MRKPLPVYFTESEREALTKALLLHPQFGSSDFVRWLVVQYASGALRDRLKDGVSGVFTTQEIISDRLAAIQQDVKVIKRLLVERGPKGSRLIRDEGGSEGAPQWDDQSPKEPRRPSK